MDTICARCPAYFHCTLDQGGSVCIRYAKEFGFDARPTNYDALVAMTPEQLAEYLVNAFWDCDDCPERDMGLKCSARCAVHCLAWLNSVSGGCDDKH